MSNVTSQDDLVCASLSVIEALKDDVILFKRILWPIFIAGLECRSQAQRDFSTSCLANFWADTNCSNAINASKILQEYWTREEYGELSSPQWIFSVGRLGCDWPLIIELVCKANRLIYNRLFYHVKKHYVLSAVLSTFFTNEYTSWDLADRSKLMKVVAVLGS